MFLLYEVVLFLAFVAALPVFLVIGFMRGKYLTNFPARMGFYRTRRATHDLWIHAVSVGEALAARPVIAAVEGMRPGTSMVITTTTITGQAQARRLYPEATVTYFPFDFTFAVRRFLDHHPARVFVTMETEIWPNVTRLAKRRRLRVMLANGRISDRSFPRYRAMRPLLSRVLSLYDRILVREETDRQRFVAMGAPADRVETTGNVKFDYTPDDTPLEAAARIERLVASRKTLVLGSTMEGEDEAFLPHIERLVRERDCFIVIAPRKAERFEHVAALLTTTSLRFARRSALTDESPMADVLLLDSFGELAKIYRYATVAFVGGSIAPFGGHNPIEPAAAGVPVAFGPHMSNFREIASAFLANQAAVEVATAADAVTFAERIFDDDALRASVGDRARKTVLHNRGASQTTARRIVELLS